MGASGTRADTPRYAWSCAMTGEEYPILELPLVGAITSDFQIHWPVCASSAHKRPSPPLELGSGAPKMTAVCPATSSLIAALEATPGPDGLPLPTLSSNGAVVVPQASAGLGATAGGYRQRTFPWFGPRACTA